VEGPATIAGIGNGDQLGLDCLTDDKHRLFFGKAMLILCSIADRAGNVIVTGASEGLDTGQARVTAGR